MWTFKVLGLLLLGSCGVLFVSSETIASEEKNVGNDAAATLSTELLPPPLPAAEEHRGIIYLINLFAIRNKTDEVPEGNSENLLTDDSPEIIGPLASVLLFVEDVGDDGVVLDDLTKELAEDDYEVMGIDAEEEPKVVQIDSVISGEPNPAQDKAKMPKKSRSKRTLFKSCKKCGDGGGGGGYNGYPSGGGGYPSGGNGGQTVGVIPILVLPYGGNQGGGGGRGGHHGGYQQHPGGGGGGGNYYHPNNGGGGYPSGGGGGYYPVGGGRGGGGGYSQSQASAQASSSSSNW